MAILKSQLAARRYSVRGEVPPDWTARFEERLDACRFVDPLSPIYKEPRIGWANMENWLDTDFSDRGAWLAEPIVYFTLRTDEKKLPPTFRKHLAKREKAWCQANNRERCPASVRTEIKELLEVEMLAHVQPKTTAVEVVWDVLGGWLLFGHVSDTPNDRFRKLFRATFQELGLEAVPASLLESQPSHRLDALLARGPIVLEVA